ncbi:MAG TPA: cob(I)yrinic acid a,c-diamide adenosyltransferase [Flavobacteriales bacterium]|jgi:cob(I)alamin adenosyltransferase|nr:cob(I)yrinic acid a,c-diamide adenosyltransferase [Flavobacteriales bacterium]HIA10792.1 cob(I)yrinic acid a,c-diamide adenosyltransferase [Flavobacteriales bacterium]
MKIYTKKGDAGQTSLLGGTRVSKNHIRIEAYGTVDELNAHIGLIRDSQKDDQINDTLINIQNCLFTVGSILASDPDKAKANIPDLLETDVQFLEKEIDRMNETLPDLKNFILPGGNLVSSHCHIARTVCRRAERITISLSLSKTSEVEPITIVYLNRLSDYLFILSRKVLMDLGGEEIPWAPRQ